MKRTKTKILSVFLSLCMIISCMVGMSVTASAESKPLAVNTIYNIGDSFVLSANSTYIVYDDDTNSYNSFQAGSYAVPQPIYNDVYHQWCFGSDLGIYLGYNQTDGTENVTGIKCVSGDGTSGNPYKFELVTGSSTPSETETLLTTITATGTEQASYSTANVATVSFSNLPYCNSLYTANWGWWGCGWTATVSPAEGYTITKCVFYDNIDNNATDSEAPFVVETAEDNKMPKVNGSYIYPYSTSAGVKKIEVYGYVTPATVAKPTVTISPEGAGTASVDEDPANSDNWLFTATPNEGYKFKWWALDHSNAPTGKYLTNTTSIVKTNFTESAGNNMITGITAVFEEDSTPSLPAWTNGNVTATLDGTKLTVEKTAGAADGTMGTSWTPKSPNTTSWTEKRATITEVEIQDGVTSIGNSAFLYCSKLASVTIPSSVTSIGISSFFGCSALTSVTIPSSVTSIGNAAFYDCTALTSVTIPNSVTSIGENTFNVCSNLTSVTFTPGTADSTLTIGANAFKDTKSGAKVAYGTGDTVLYDNDTQITTETLLTAIQNKTLTWKAASSTPSWTNGNVTATLNGTKLTVEKKPDTDGAMGTDWTAVGTTTWWGYVKGTITEVEIQDGVTSIGNSAFVYCEALTSVDIPSTVTSIGEYAFNGCSALTSVTIPNSVTSIGKGAFMGCSALTSVTIPSKVISIGMAAFNNCTDLTSVTFIPGTADATLSIGVAAFNSTKSGATVAYGTGNTVLYDNDTPITTETLLTAIENKTLTWKAASSTPAYQWTNGNVTATLDGTKLTVEKTAGAADGTMGTSWTKVGSAPTWSTIKETITEVEIKDGVTSIGANAFNRCSNLTSVTFPSGLTSIGDAAFANCSALTSVTFPSSLNSIGQRAFHVCSVLASVTFTPGQEGAGLTIGDSAFDDIPSTTKVTYGTGNTVLYDDTTEITTDTLLTAIQRKSLTWKAASSTPATTDVSFVRAASAEELQTNLPNIPTYTKEQAEAWIAANKATLAPAYAAHRQANGDAAFVVVYAISEHMYSVLVSGNSDLSNFSATEQSLGELKNNFTNYYDMTFYPEVTAATHTHTWGYNASGATITANCTGTGDCDITEGLTLTISAPASTSLTYDGTAKEASLSTGYNTTAFPGTYTIEYYNGTTKLGSAPVNAGTYTAKVTAGTGDGAVTASVDFTITPKTVSSPTITLSPESFTYDGSAKQPTVTVKDGTTTIPASEYNIEYSNNTNAGTATVTITDKTGGNYTVSGTKTFTIAPASQTAPAVSSTNETVAGKADGTITGVTTAMEYKLSTATEYTPITGTSVTGLAAGTYNVRYAADANHEASPAADVVINVGSKITVQFNANGGTPEPEDQQFNYNQTVSKPATDPTKTGYTFKFWSADGTAEYDFNTPLTANITLTAVYQVNSYTITFDTDGGSAIAPITQDYNTAVTAPADPTKTGYTFAGWEPAIPETMPAENVTVKATWTINPYTITFVSFGKTVEEYELDYGTNVPVPATPSVEGLRFVGWRPSIPATMPAEDLVITALWSDDATRNNARPEETSGGSSAPTFSDVSGSDETKINQSTQKMWAQLNDDNSVTVGWDKISGASKYVLYYEKDGKEVQVTETAKTKITMKTAKNGFTYKFRLKYITSGQTLDAPTGYTANLKVYYKPIVKLTQKDGKVTAKWAKVTGAEYYKVYKVVNGKLKLVTETTKTAVRFKATKGKTYTYTVSAVVDGVETPLVKSDRKSIKVK